MSVFECWFLGLTVLQCAAALALVLRPSLVHRLERAVLFGLITLPCAGGVLGLTAPRAPDALALLGVWLASALGLLVVLARAYRWGE